MIDRRVEEAVCNFIGVDDEEIGRMATEHLIQAGCRRIAHIRGPEISTGNGRVRGYLSALSAYGISSHLDYVVSRESIDARADTMRES